MPKVDKQEVFRVIEEERRYQMTKEYHSDEVDAGHSMADWIIFLDLLVNSAKQKVYFLKPEHALEEVRKIAAVAVACMENNGAPTRFPPDKEK